jgi:hypothetical protein
LPWLKGKTHRTFSSHLLTLSKLSENIVKTVNTSSPAATASSLMCPPLEFARLMSKRQRTEQHFEPQTIQQRMTQQHHYYCNRPYSRPITPPSSRRTPSESSLLVYDWASKSNSADDPSMALYHLSRRPLSTWIGVQDFKQKVHNAQKLSHDTTNIQVPTTTESHHCVIPRNRSPYISYVYRVMPG